MCPFSFFVPEQRKEEMTKTHTRIIIQIFKKERRISMNYQEFQEALLKELAYRLDSRIKLHPTIATKNNDTKLHGLVFQDNTSNIATVLYLDAFYEKFQDDMPITTIAEDIVKLSHQAAKVNLPDANILFDYGQLQKQILYKFINLKANQELLKDVPHIPYLDLAIVFYVLLDCRNDGSMATILIRNKHLELWKKDVQALLSDAHQNTRNIFPAELIPMSEIVSNIPLDEDRHTISDPDTELQPELFILTNSVKQQGAVCVLYDGILNQIWNFLQEDYFIIPSSIHETMIVRASGAAVNYLNEMIQEVNELAVSPEDRLSDHAYFYAREHQKLLRA